MPRRPIVPHDVARNHHPHSSLTSATPHVSPAVAPDAPQREVSARASRLLAEAHALLDQDALRQRSLEACLALLQQAAPGTYFHHTLDPPTLTPVHYCRRGSRKARWLRPRFEAALAHMSERAETIRFNTLLALARLGIPVALWHFLVPTPLPQDFHSLAPQAQ